MRERLPNRRRSIAGDIVWQESVVTLHAGLNADGHIREIFIRPQGNIGKTGTAFQELTTHFAVLMSNLLRNGVTVEQLHGMFSRQYDGGPASIAGAACDWLLNLQREMRA